MSAPPKPAPKPAPKVTARAAALPQAPEAALEDPDEVCLHLRYRGHEVTLRRQKHDPDWEILHDGVPRGRASWFERALDEAIELLGVPTLSP